MLYTSSAPLYVRFLLSGYLRNSISVPCGKTYYELARLQTENMAAIVAGAAIVARSKGGCNGYIAQCVLSTVCFPRE